MFLKFVGERQFDCDMEYCSSFKVCECNPEIRKIKRGKAPTFRPLNLYCRISQTGKIKIVCGDYQGPL